MIRRTGTSIVMLFLLAGAIIAWPRFTSTPRSSGPLSHSVYVWQREWNEDVAASVRRASDVFGETVFLTAEISFPSDRPTVATVPLDFGAIAGLGKPIGLAVRIGTPSARSGDSIFATDSPVTALLQSVVRDELRHARSQGVNVAELQIDFDCAASKLNGYRQWVAALRPAVSPARLTITALPSWLGRSSFAQLAHECDGYVLQVHSLHKPAGPDKPMTLCDRDEAIRAVEQAGRLGVPFRVSLPTYGYVVGFDSSNHLQGLSAEGPLLKWPADAKLRELRADPDQLSQLVRDWTADRPAAFVGLCWYRLSVNGDRLNWRWPTLLSVMNGDAPRAKLVASTRRREPGLVDVEIQNIGDNDAVIDTDRIAVRLGDSTIAASDAIGGFLIESQKDSIELRRDPDQPPVRLSPGEHRTVAWLRLAHDTEVVAHVDTLPDN